MKKVLAMILTMVMVVSLGLVSVSALSVAPTAEDDLGAFVTSPSGNPAPELVSAESESEDCPAEVIVTPYSERHTLPEDIRDMNVDAYDQIRGTSDVTTLADGLAAYAESKNVAPADLAVSDLFDVRYEGCDDHDEHGSFDIVLSSETFENFVALMYYDGENWHLVEGAEVKSVDGQLHLYFTTEHFSPFAVVVNTGDEVPATPSTGDNSHIAIYAVVMAASAALLVVVFIASKKSKKADPAA